MPLVPPTLDQFKTQFLRAFPYSVPSFGATGTAVLTAGVVTAVNVTAGGSFYQKPPLVQFATDAGGTGATATATVTNNAVTAIVVTAGGTGYIDVPTVTIVSQDGDDTDLSKVTNTDIISAAGIAVGSINPLLFRNQGPWATCFNLLTAHYLCVNLLNSSQGVKSQYDWLTTQRTVGNVSSSFGIPDRVLKNAFFSTLTSTRFGAEYLGIIWPMLHGNVRTVIGDSTP